MQIIQHLYLHMSRLIKTAINLMVFMLSGFLHQQISVPIFTLTQWYIYYGLVTHFGPYLDHHQASPVTWYTYSISRD
jgi:hypothetical protein